MLLCTQLLYVYSEVSLTPVEYERLQGFPDGFTDVLSTSQRYVTLGNALPPPMAEWAISRVLAPSGISIADVDVDIEMALF